MLSTIFPEMKGTQSDVFLNFYLLLSLPLCLFSHFQPLGHGFALLSVPMLLGEHSPTWLIFGFWYTTHGQLDYHAYRVVFRVINNNNDKTVSFTHTIYSEQCSKHLAYMIDLFPVILDILEYNYFTFLWCLWGIITNIFMCLNLGK